MYRELTKDDVLRLAREPSPEVRAELTVKICDGFNRHHFKNNELDVARQIIRLLASDAESRVRKTLADHLKYNAELPHDVAVKLSRDVLEVATPILEFSPVLNDDDLIDIIQSTQEAGRKMAIARREYLSEKVANTLTQYSVESEEVIHTLTKNKGAKLTDATVGFILDNMPESETVLETLVYRGGLSIRIAERLVTMVAEHLKHELIHKYKLTRKDVEKATTTAREYATVGLTGNLAEDSHIVDLTRHLKEKNRLTFSTMLRALCMGDLRFFEASMATLADIPLPNARKLLRDTTGFRALYQKSEMPMSVFDAVNKVLKIVQEESRKGAKTKEEYQARIVERIISEGRELPLDSMTYLMSVIQKGIHSNDTLQ